MKARQDLGLGDHSGGSVSGVCGGLQSSVHKVALRMRESVLNAGHLMPHQDPYLCLELHKFQGSLGCGLGVSRVWQSFGGRVRGWWN